MQILLNLESQPAYTHWVVKNDPKVVEEILKNGRALEHAALKIDDWPRGDFKPHALFEALKSNRVCVGGIVRNFRDWCAHWDQIRKEAEIREAEIRHQQRLERARKTAIAEVRRLRPNQIDVQVLVEESPPREFEELSNSSSDLQESSSRLNNNYEYRYCELNTDCKDVECKLIHF